jgi:two-component system sensor histidine kinase UhpB
MTDQWPPRPSIETRRRAERRGELLWLLAYPLAWIALFHFSTPYWNLPAGLRVGWLLLLDRRSWPWMMVVEWAVLLGLRFFGGDSWFHGLPAQLLVSLAPWGIYALAVHVVGPRTIVPLSAQSIPRLLLLAAVGASANALMLTFAIWLDGGTAQPGTKWFTFALGSFAGIVLVVPLMLLARDRMLSTQTREHPLLAKGLVVLPAALVALSLLVPDWERFALICALIPLLWLAARDGWRPAALAALLLSITTFLTHDSAVTSWQPAQLQLLIAITASAALMIGSTREALADQGRALARAVDMLSKRTQALSDAANRLTSQQEEDRRRLGRELHDELGQDMTAIATQLRLVERGVGDTEVRNQLRGIERLVDTAHDHLRVAIGHLHPLVLDRFGLARALSAGPLAEMTRGQRIDYRCEIEGDVDALPMNIATAIYRICQEVVTNGVRHGCGGRLHLRLRLRVQPDASETPLLTLTAEDDAGLLKIPRGNLGFGLQGIRDRANAIGATYIFSLDSGVPRHWLQLAVPAASASA